MALTMKRVAKLVSRGEPGRHFDGSGLYLVIAGKAAAHWERRYQLHDREHYLGLGSAGAFNLTEARERNRRVSQTLADKIDPLEQRRAERARRAAQAARTVTFGECAEEYFKTNAPTWKHQAHIAQWSASVLGRTLLGKVTSQDYCHSLRRLPVGAIDTPIVMQVLRPLWHEKPETMSRIRARIASVLDWAKAAGYRQGDNPAALEIIGKLLPSRAKVAKVEHFAAVDYREMPQCMHELRQRHGSAARALEFAVLTATRTAEVLDATWPEFDLNEATWVIPPERMKGGREHRIPLSPEALKLLNELPREGNIVFVGPQEGKGLSKMSLVAVMRRMGRSEVPHGFRSSFSDWAHERTGHSNHAIELSLAHSIGNATEKAYRRADMFAKRRRLMEQWSGYCTSPPAAEKKSDRTVVSIRR
jgi:integrase